MMDMTVMSDVSVMTDISMSYISQLEEEVQSLCVENQQLRNALESELLTEKVLSQNVYFQQDQVLHWASFSCKTNAWLYLTSLHHSLSQFPFSSVTIWPIPCTPFQCSQFHIVMIRSKVDWLKTKRSYISNGLLVPNCMLFIMPASFRRNFKMCAIIIDCFEIFIERPTSLAPTAQTWSSYKQHNTVNSLGFWICWLTKI